MTLIFNVYKEHNTGHAHVPISGLYYEGHRNYTFFTDRGEY